MRLPIALLRSSCLTAVLVGGALAVSPSDASPEEAPRKGDLETARLLGARVAGYAVRTRG